MTDGRAAAAVSVGLAALSGVAAWLIGVSLAQSAFLATGVMTAGAGYTIFLLHDTVHADGRWPERPAPAPDGARRDLQALSSGLAGRRRAVSEDSRRRLRTVAEHRLARHGIDLADPGQAGRARQLLGSHAFQVVTADPTHRVRYAAFERCVAAIEHLDALRLPTPAAGRPSTREHHP